MTGVDKESPTGGAGAATIAAGFTSSGKRAALMPYLMGGFPTLAASLGVGEAYAESGADLVELGVPFSDPLADGPVIHAAGTAALAAGARLSAVLDVGRDIAESVPVVVMCYTNLILARGVERFAADLAERGLSGLIVPDMPLEESAALRDACDGAGVALVPLLAPTTPERRLAAITARARGFLYTVSVAGTTGERGKFADDLPDLLARARAQASVPVALGFGIGTPAAAADAAAAGADGVIVGSRLVRAVAAEPDPASAVRVAAELVGEFAAALR